MTQTDLNSLSVTTSFRRGESWADQAESPGWVAKAEPKFSEEIPEIVLEEREYDLKPSRSNSSVLSVYVGGLDYSLDSRALEEFFRSRGCRVSRVRVLQQNGKSSGKAFLNVADKAALEEVVKLNGSTLAGRQIVVREDLGAKPQSRGSSRGFEKPANMGGRWREEQHQSKGSNGWSTVVNGKKETVAPTVEYRKKRVSNEKKEVKEVEESVAEIPKERKKLELKPRSKPIGEDASGQTVSRPASIFGNAKPRDETAFQKNTCEEEEKEKTAGVAVEIPAKRKERKVSVPAPVIIEEPVVVKPVAVKKRTSKNRFAVDDDSGEDEEEAVSSSE